VWTKRGPALAGFRVSVPSVADAFGALVLAMRDRIGQPGAVRPDAGVERSPVRAG
jgi:hypothetical protein